jgi:hypothetical protein
MKTLLTSALLVCSAGMVVGCGSGGKKPSAPETAPPRYEVLPPKEVPSWLRGSVLERADLVATEPQRVASYGLVTGLDFTGDPVNIPNTVREYMINQMVKRGFGRATVEGFERASPERVLQDRRTAVVRVDALIPPGAREGDRVDALVSALEDNDTSSLAGGNLYLTELTPRGGTVGNPGESVGVRAVARGPVMVNPVYAYDSELTDPEVRRSLRRGVILNGARVAVNRPLVLRIRSAEARIARATDLRLDQQFGSDTVGAAQDEGIVFLNMPARFHGDWEHFAGVALHTFFFAGNDFAVIKARELVQEAVKPDASLQNLSYAMEALGPAAVPIIEELLTHEKPEVVFAAARAAAFTGSNAAELTLFQIASDLTNPFSVDATRVLGRLPRTPRVTTNLRALLDAPGNLVRAEAYLALARENDVRIATRPVGDKFVLDQVESTAPPMIFITQRGLPRIAFIGPPARLAESILFTADESRFSISREPGSPFVVLFHRGTGLPEPIRVRSRADLPEVVARLGGEGPAGERRLSFNFGQIVALLMRLDAEGLITSTAARPSLVLQEPVDSRILTAPPIDPGRPVTDNPQASN